MPGYLKKVRNAPKAIKDQVYRNYGISARNVGDYKIDHLIGRELGGSNSIANLWPESISPQPLNAHAKDKLEQKLHQLVCSGRIPVQRAQQEIATNWLAAYQKYVGPLPEGIQMPATRELSVAESPPGMSPRSAPRVPDDKSLIKTTEEHEVVAQASYPPSQPNEFGHCPSSSPIKGSRNHFYFLPGDPKYQRTKAEYCFATPEAAQAADYRPPKR
jgi:hypothetical protein